METIEEFVKNYLTVYDLHVEDGEYNDFTVEQAVIAGYEFAQKEFENKVKWHDPKEELPEDVMKLIKYPNEKHPIGIYTPKVIIKYKFRSNDAIQYDIAYRAYGFVDPFIWVDSLPGIIILGWKEIE